MSERNNKEFIGKKTVGGYELEKLFIFPHETHAFKNYPERKS